jgi:hypothetical protein
MTPELFQSLLDCYGADLSRWPDEHQSAAGHFLRQSPEAKAAVDQAMCLDQVILAAAPAVSDARAEAACRAVLAQTEALPQSPAWLGWNWAPGGLTYAGLFLLGGLGNVLTRLFSQESPIDSLFSSNLLTPFGG